ncbi:MAG: FHA domain-containing protein [Phycisphaerae bacterium]
MDVKLIFFKSSGQRKDIPVTKSEVIIGRGEQCDVRVPIPSVSRRHCQLTLGEEGVKVRDFGSSNGTYVNNERVTEATLSAGDRLVVGPVMFTLQINGEPGDVQPVKTRGQKMAEAGEPGAEEVVDLEADIVVSSMPEPPAEPGNQPQPSQGQPTAPLPQQQPPAVPHETPQKPPAPPVAQQQPAEQPAEPEPVEFPGGQKDISEDDIDPIAALEALAREEDEDEEENKQG